MTIISRLKTRAREVRLERLQTGAVRRDIRKQARAASFVTEREEAIKVAKERGRARARRPSGLAGFTAGLQTFSKGLSRIAPPQKGRGKQPTMADVLGGTRNGTKPKGRSMLDIKF